MQVRILPTVPNFKEQKMKSYPSIPRKVNFKLKYIAFDKLDGSNIRAEWSKKKGFYKFGSRTQLLSEQQVALYPSIELIKEKYEENVTRMFNNMGHDRGICFFEYFGPNSFAGSHTDPVQNMNAVLIDINPYKKGIIEAEEFLEVTQGMEVPDVLHTGILDEEFVDSVKDGTLEGMTLEGVVVKAIGKKHNAMAKIKSRIWLDKLKEYCNNDPQLFNRLK